MQVRGTSINTAAAFWQSTLVLRKLCTKEGSLYPCKYHKLNMCLDHAKICDGWLDFHRAHGPPLETRARMTTECTHFFLCCVLEVTEVCLCEWWGDRTRLTEYCVYLQRICTSRPNTKAAKCAVTFVHVCRISRSYSMRVGGQYNRRLANIPLGSSDGIFSGTACFVERSVVFASFLEHGSLTPPILVNILWGSAWSTRHALLPFFKKNSTDRALTLAIKSFGGRRTPNQLLNTPKLSFCQVIGNIYISSQRIDNTELTSASPENVVHNV